MNFKNKYKIKSTKTDMQKDQEKCSQSKLVVKSFSLFSLDFMNVKIISICSTDKVALFLSSNLNNYKTIFLDEGTLYMWGDDSENKYGLLGLSDQYKAT